MRHPRWLCAAGAFMCVACGSYDSDRMQPAGRDRAQGHASSRASLDKWELWQRASYFRGFDVGYFNPTPGTKELQDFLDLRATGANLAQIQSNEGTRHVQAPYDTNPLGVEALDNMVSWCRAAGLNYVIAVRAGPGRQPVDAGVEDSIWTNPAEQRLYAAMLRDDIVRRYQADPLFVGINLMVEPNPLGEAAGTPEELGPMLAAAGIDVNAMMSRFIQEIRSIDTTLPIIVQSVFWSDPRFFSLLEKQADPYVVYDCHAYDPRAYTHPSCGKPHCSGAYPGRFDGDYYDRAYLESAVFGLVRTFASAHRVPILVGEFGMEFPQPGGPRYLADMKDIALANGWHFCLWSYRGDSRNPASVEFDYEKWGPEYWNEILRWFAP
jgi:hypothetical protein